MCISWCFGACGLPVFLAGGEWGALAKRLRPHVSGIPGVARWPGSREHRHACLMRSEGTGACLASHARQAGAQPGPRESVRGRVFVPWRPESRV